MLPVRRLYIPRLSNSSAIWSRQRRLGAVGVVESVVLPYIWIG